MSSSSGCRSFVCGDAFPVLADQLGADVDEIWSYRLGSFDAEVIGDRSSGMELDEDNELGDWDKDVAVIGIKLVEMMSVVCIEAVGEGIV